MECCERSKQTKVRSERSQPTLERSRGGSRRLPSHLDASERRQYNAVVDSPAKLSHNDAAGEAGECDAIPRGCFRMKTVSRAGLLTITLLLAFALAFALFMLNKPMGTGSTSYADDWMERLSDISSPDEAQRKYDDVAVKRFEHGEWIVGVCRDSHASMFGGTIVTRDSRGNTRAFFGHVCGSSFLKATFTRANDIDAVYGALLNGCRFREHKR